jgi:hypothetical protein
MMLLKINHHMLYYLLIEFIDHEFELNITSEVIR